MLKRLVVWGILLASTTHAVLAFDAVVAVGPDCNTGILTDALRSARFRIQLNIYQIEKPALVDALIQKIETGVAVQVLAEGHPFGGLSKGGILALESLRDAMARHPGAGHWLRLMYKKDPAIRRRFPFNHAKYMVVDGERSWISSDNWSENGHPEAGKKGNRGWDIVIHHKGVAAELTRVLEGDANPLLPDVLEIHGSDPIPRDPSGETESPPQIGLKSMAGFVPEKVDVEAAEIITSPDSAPALQSLIRSARSTIRVEHMGFPRHWQVGSRKDPNPILEELVAAAQRGVRVRVLLNDEGAFGTNEAPDPEAENGPRALQAGNDLTVKYLNDLARRRKLPIEARIVDYQGLGITYIHNKGILVDDDLSLVSSINGSRNSVLFNRELAVQLKSRGANRYFTQVFDADWAASKRRRRTDAELQFGYLR